MGQQRVRIDITGRRFGWLLVLDEAPHKRGEVLHWHVLCDCGTRLAVAGSHLRSGNTKSCGCLQRERSSAKTAARNFKHGQTHSLTYGSWAAMKLRCLNPSEPAYPLYGGRGVTICARWLEFDNFIADMGPRPSSKHSIDRWPDRNGNYEPGNCRWATTGEQSRNKRSNVELTFAGKTMCVEDWAAAQGINPNTLRRRLRRGWGTDRALTEPVDHRYSRVREQCRA